jgi:hypothetical protein
VSEEQIDVCLYQRISVERLFLEQQFENHGEHDRHNQEMWQLVDLRAPELAGRNATLD